MRRFSMNNGCDFNCCNYSNDNNGNYHNETSTAGKVAGALMGIGAVVAVIGALFGKKDEPRQLNYAIPREGRCVTDYTPYIPSQQPIQQPVVMKPNIPAPEYVPTYQSAYPWGYNAYIATIANAPMQNNSMSYQYYPVQVSDMSGGYYYASPKVFEYNTDYGRSSSYTPPKPYIQPAPPGYNMSPQYSYNMNGGMQYQPTYYTQQQPIQQSPQIYTYDYSRHQQSTPVVNTGNAIMDGLFNQQMNPSPVNTNGSTITSYVGNVQPMQQQEQRCEYDFSKRQDSSVRTLNNGCESAFNIPGCYDNSGNWKGWS